MRLTGRRTNLLVKIQRDHRRRRIEHRTHGPHERRQERCNHQTHDSRGQEIHDQCGKRNIAVGNLAVHHGENLWIERESDQPRNNQQEHRQYLQKSREDGPRFRVPFISRRQYTLHDHLVRAPVPDTENRRAEKYSRPGKFAVRRRPHHVEITGRNCGAKPGKSADFFQSDKRKRQCA